MGHRWRKWRLSSSENLQDQTHIPRAEEKSTVPFATGPFSQGYPERRADPSVAFDRNQIILFFYHTPANRLTQFFKNAFGTLGVSPVGMAPRI